MKGVSILKGKRASTFEAPNSLKDGGLDSAALGGFEKSDV